MEGESLWMAVESDGAALAQVPRDVRRGPRHRGANRRCCARPGLVSPETSALGRGGPLPLLAGGCAAFWRALKQRVCPRPPGAVKRPQRSLAFSIENPFCMRLLYGRAGRAGRVTALFRRFSARADGWPVAANGSLGAAALQSVHRHGACGRKERPGLELRARHDDPRGRRGEPPHRGPDKGVHGSAPAPPPSRLHTYLPTPPIPRDRRSWILATKEPLDSGCECRA